MILFSMIRPPPRSTLFPSTTLFPSHRVGDLLADLLVAVRGNRAHLGDLLPPRRRHRDLLQLVRSEEHTSELQSRLHLVCRLLLEKKNAGRSTCANLPAMRLLHMLTS